MLLLVIFERNQLQVVQGIVSGITVFVVNVIAIRNLAISILPDLPVE
jgi:hypothetical protein